MMSASLGTSPPSEAKHYQVRVSNCIRNNPKLCMVRPRRLMINSYPHANFSRILPKCQSFTLLIICLAQDAVNGSKNGLFGDDLMPTLISAHGGPCFVVDILWSRMVVLSQLCQVIAIGSFFAVVVEANIHTFEVFTSMRMAPLLQTVIRLSIRSIQQPILNNSIASWREHNLVVVSTCIILYMYQCTR